jgi:cobalt/nickel transport system permease protein
LADLATYIVTAFQLALAFPAASGVFTSFKAFLAIFAVTQIPLAVVEGTVTSFMFKYILHSRSEVLVRLNVVSRKAVQKLQEVPA